ncbi:MULTISPECIES: hypothetical protein [Streptomyces]|uniref:Secreted protein n=1 Tax=Streptomyces clavifer TaxID=68188 RepID=A0ABS4VBB8_9ACTN|nr:MULTISPECIES: hypothetical protein [Streptomyces]KQX78875.1 hypothetical protein ASD26_10190 [Streptomyces sp. Root1319]KQZ03783.1 hypothetical protein ASD51_18340 [Streptomyces sp. Root55]MBP2361213.1 hypothetical protein [Streptomyces clavifer]MDX2746158.1 hypothetical protein [Streptomyces sp. NRRL_B-2557]MDX3064394.1 hypothetical protein [Streptomyces sp. ND04-05B]
MSESPVSGPPPQIPAARPPAPQPKPPATTLRQRLAELRGPSVAPHPLDARALAALAANPGCKRRALLDGAGVDKGVLATSLGSPAPFGQSQFALVRGNAFEKKVKADGGTELLRLLFERLGSGADAPGEATVPDLTAAGPAGRAARTALALREATAAGGWALLDHPMLALEVAGSPAYLEPDAVVVHPDGTWTVVEIKSFPMVDSSADAAKVGAAARQSAVYVLALERIAEVTEGAEVGHRVLLVCPKDFSNLPTASVVDVRKQRAVTRRQLTRLTRVEDIAAALPEGTTFDPGCSPEELGSAVDAVPAAYAPECLAACELAFHCRAKARAEGAVETLGRSVRGELGGLTTVAGVLAAAAGKEGDPADPTVAALRRAAALRAEALESPGSRGGGAACH